jgi:hypothetical protein
MKRIRIISLELALVLASVFVFRGLWMLLDTWPWMDRPAALWGSFVLGCVITVWALNGLMAKK